MSHHIDLDELTASERYKLLTALVIPRPIAWVTTVSSEGITNAAPYSFFNVFGQDPAIIILGLEHKADGTAKDTENNINTLNEFVVNLVSSDILEKMVQTAAAYAPGESEPDILGLSLTSSKKVKPPRLTNAPVSIECERMMSLSLSRERSILIGRAVGVFSKHFTLTGRIITQSHVFLLIDMLKSKVFLYFRFQHIYQQKDVRLGNYSPSQREVFLHLSNHF